MEELISTAILGDVPYPSSARESSTLIVELSPGRTLKEISSQDLVHDQ
jgi:hypothetical protein